MNFGPKYKVKKGPVKESSNDRPRDPIEMEGSHDLNQDTKEISREEIRSMHEGRGLRKKKGNRMGELGKLGGEEGGDTTSSDFQNLIFEQKEDYHLLTKYRKMNVVEGDGDLVVAELCSKKVISPTQGNINKGGGRWKRRARRRCGRR